MNEVLRIVIAKLVGLRQSSLIKGRRISGSPRYFVFRDDEWCYCRKVLTATANEVWLVAGSNGCKGVNAVKL